VTERESIAAATKNITVAQYDATVANYRQTVLTVHSFPAVVIGVREPRLVWQLNYVEFYFPSISLIDAC
jgi:hypothetical protein